MIQEMIQKTHGLNGHPASAPSQAVTVQVCSELVVAIGTTASNQIRIARQHDIDEFGSVPPHKRYVGIDTTSQADIGVTPLDPAEFINLSDGPRMLLSLLTWALAVPRIAAWLSAKVAGAAVGDGSGAMPGVARFLFEQSLPLVAKRINEILDGFRLAHRGNLAAGANAHPGLQSQRATLAPTGKVNVTIVASTTGGTVGILFYVVLYLKSRLKQLSIDANFTLVLSLPACGADNVDTLRMRELCYGRLSELMDFNGGRTLAWQADDEVVFCGKGPFFNCTLVMPEPSTGKLPAHNQRVGRFLSLLHSPHLGTALRQTVVDMVQQFSDEGPHGQQKFLARVGFSEVFPAAFPDPTRFAAVRLGLAATATVDPNVDSAAEVERLLARHGFKSFESLLPKLDPPAVAPQVNEARYAGLVEIERKKRQTEARSASLESIRQFNAAIERLKLEACGVPDGNEASETQVARIGMISQVALNFGPAAAAEFAGTLSRRFEALLLTIENQLGQSPPANSNAGANLQDRYQTVADQAQFAACKTVLEAACTEVNQLLSDFAVTTVRYERLAEVVAVLHDQYLQQSREFEPQHARPHALLGYESLCRLIDATAPACIAAVRATIDASAQLGRDPASLPGGIQAAVEQHASSARKFASFDEAWRTAGEGAETAIANAQAAAEPNARLVVSLDVAQQCAQRMFVTLPPDHPLLPVLARSGREVTAVRPQSSNHSVVLVSLDIGLEPASFVAAREAVAAHVQRARADFPPFADRRFEPEHELVIPPRNRWHVHLALPLHWYLGTNAIEVAGDGRWTYCGVPIGNSYAEAMASLVADEGRNAQLPDLVELSEEVLSLIGSGGPAIKLLGELESSLQDQLESLRRAGEVAASPPADPKWLFALRQARGITRSLAANLKRALRDIDVLRKGQRKGTNGHDGGKNGAGHGQI